jgi:hypothetical protein
VRALVRLDGRPICLKPVENNGAKAIVGPFDLNAPVRHQQGPVLRCADNNRPTSLSGIRKPQNDERQALADRRSHFSCAG